MANLTRIDMSLAETLLWFPNPPPLNHLWREVEPLC